MSADCVCRTERETRILRAIFRRTQIDNRNLCVPYSTAYDWVPIPPRDLSDEAAAESRGPTTAERMELYAEHAAPLAVRSAERFCHQLTSKKIALLRDYLTPDIVRLRV